MPYLSWRRFRGRWACGRVGRACWLGGVRSDGGKLTDWGRRCHRLSSLYIADCFIEHIDASSGNHANDPPSADSPQDHVPMLVHLLLNRGDRIRRHGYIPPQLLLVGNVRCEHVDMRDSCADARACEQWGVRLVHTLWCLLYRWLVIGQALHGRVSVVYERVIRSLVTATACMNDTAMGRRLVTGMTQHHCRPRGQGGMAYSTYHRLAASCSTGRTRGGVMLDEVEVLRVVHIWVGPFSSRP
jgi:hypothetical protein